MPSQGTGAVIAQASQLDDIGFVEFTTKLVSDVFDSLIAANIRQQEAFVELLQNTSKSLTEFVNDTKDDIGAGEIMQLLSAILPPDNADANAPPTKLAVGSSLSAADATTINDAIEVAGAGVTDDNKVASAGNVSDADYQMILKAVAIRIAANKYTLLTEMVRQGMLRLVVEDGLIETRLNFRAFGSDYYNKYENDMQSKAFAFRAQAKTGGLLAKWVKASASTSYNSMRVSTTTESEGANSNATVNIMGGVRIEFRTDYLPLNVP